MWIAYHARAGEFKSVVSMLPSIQERDVSTSTLLLWLIPAAVSKRVTRSFQDSRDIYPDPHRSYSLNNKY